MKNCYKCEKEMPLVYEYGEGFACLYFCRACRTSIVDYEDCVHQLETALYFLSPTISQVTTKCIKCDRFFMAHKKKDVDVKNLPVKERYNNPEAPYLIKYQEALKVINLKIEELKLGARKASNEWNIQEWYNGYLRSNVWKRKREHIFKRADYQCERCGIKAQQVHHLTYERVGYEKPEDLIAVCLRCHAREHRENPGLDIVSQFKVHNLANDVREIK